jgi:hypothetical protein
MSRPPLDKKTKVVCQGSNCAAWEWFDPITTVRHKERRGYCGKVGKPLVELYGDKK